MEWAHTPPDLVAMRDMEFGVGLERTSAQVWDEVITGDHGLLAR